MLDLRSVAEEKPFVKLPFTGEFAFRFTITLLMSFMDVVALVAVSRVAFHSVQISVALQAAFAILFLGLGASLGRMWFLTVRILTSSRIALSHSKTVSIEAHTVMPPPHAVLRSASIEGRPLTRGH